VEIKRQVWLIDEGLFRDKVFPLLNQHISETHEFAQIDNPLPPARRESHAATQELVHVIGKSVALYNMLLHFFRTLLASTHNSGFCTLRADLLMALHDVGVSEIYHLDPCHKFTWCLDACVRDGAVELRRIKEMQYYFWISTSCGPHPRRPRNDRRKSTRNEHAHTQHLHDIGGCGESRVNSER
jgi:negative elongation factor B